MLPSVTFGVVRGHFLQRLIQKLLKCPRNALPQRAALPEEGNGSQQTSERAPSSAGFPILCSHHCKCVHSCDLGMLRQALPHTKPNHGTPSSEKEEEMRLSVHHVSLQICWGHCSRQGMSTTLLDQTIGKILWRNAKAALVTVEKLKIICSPFVPVLRVSRVGQGVIFSQMCQEGWGGAPPLWLTQHVMCNT